MSAAPDPKNLLHAVADARDGAEALSQIQAAFACSRLAERGDVVEYLLRRATESRADGTIVGHDLACVFERLAADVDDAKHRKDQ